ncbi:MAG TPA: sensor histidine kinase [Sphingomicrobium sp.]|nr:sensor histidine kinase [Sphingomicrobium sp.]
MANWDSAIAAAPRQHKGLAANLLEGRGEPRLNPVKILKDFALGLLAALAAVAVRYSLGLPAGVLPFFTVVIAVSLVTVAAGLIGGLTTMVVGGFLACYFIMPPSAAVSLDGGGSYALIGYFAITGMILATSQLYRRSEERRQAAALALARQDAEHQTFFAREMSHRLKNAMAIVQALARQTFDHETPEVDKFEGRLKALADAHNLLTEHVKQPTASVEEVVSAAIAPFMALHRFDLDGPSLALPSQQVVLLALALHELGTNALKYGALSIPEGRIAIRWDAFDGGLWLEWKEQRGPPVAPPAADGFGSRLLRRAAMGAHVAYEVDGVRCTMALKH